MCSLIPPNISISRLVMFGGGSDGMVSQHTRLSPWLRHVQISNIHRGPVSVPNVDLRSSSLQISGDTSGVRPTTKFTGWLLYEVQPLAFCRRLHRTLGLLARAPALQPCNLAKADHEWAEATEEAERLMLTLDPHHHQPTQLQVKPAE